MRGEGGVERRGEERGGEGRGGEGRGGEGRGGEGGGGMRRGSEGRSETLKGCQRKSDVSEKSTFFRLGRIL